MRRRFLPFLFLSLAVALPLATEKEELKCHVCREAMTALLPLFRSNHTLERVEAVAVEVCEHFGGAGFCKTHKACMDLCPGIVAAYGPAVVSVLLQNGKIGADEICTLAKMCKEKQVTPILPPPPFPAGALRIRSNLSDLSGEKQWKQWSKGGEGTVGSFVQLTDVHLDVQYMPGTETQCGEPTCCRARNGPPLDSHRAAGRYGDYACDTSPELARSLWSTLHSDFAPRIDFALLTGDEPTHDVWMQSQEHNAAAIDNVSSGLLQALASVPTFPCIGNHAAFPADLFQGEGKDSWLYTRVAEDWKNWLPNDALRTLAIGGYYAARARPGLWIVAMHTSILSSDDVYLRVNESAPDLNAQLPWLNDTLAQIRARGDQALLIGHARPTTFIEPLRSQFYEIAYSNQDIIVGYLFGHAHPSELSLLRMADDQPPFAVAYAAASVTTFTDLNPGMREWKYTRAGDAPLLSSSTAASSSSPFTGGEAQRQNEIVGWTEYWVDLVEANKHDTPPQWVARYEAPQFFNLPSLSPLAWEAYAKRINHDSTALAQWYWTWSKGGPAVPPASHFAVCDILQTADCANA